MPQSRQLHCLLPASIANLNLKRGVWKNGQIAKSNFAEKSVPKFNLGTRGKMRTEVAIYLLLFAPWRLCVRFFNPFGGDYMTCHSSRRSLGISLRKREGRWTISP